MDVTAAHMGVDRDDFLRHLSTSGLLGDAELNSVRSDDSCDVISIAASLSSKGLLTPFQIDALTAGRPEDLRVGNYDVLNKLGQGGMGVVFKARHRRMKRLVAIKVLSTHLCKDASFVARFQREVETVARMGHPNIVMAYDADEADIGHFLVMEFVDGRDLASEVAKNGPVDPPRAVDYMLQTARGLAYAHSEGIVHRDVKPHNLLKDERGTIKVTDLGLASLAISDSAPKSELTQSGGILGTVDYMPPEQAIDSASIDARADIYSLGCTLYFLLTGSPPFTGPSMMSILLKHREDPIPTPDSPHGSLPPRLDEIYRKMMAKSVDDRYQTMAEVVRDLERLQADMGGKPVHSAPAVPASPGSRPGTSSPSSISLAGPEQKTITERPELPLPMAVLIVEPSRLQAGFIRKYLEQAGIKVSAVVATGEQAVEAIRLEKPRAILASLYLADMTGIELAQKIRAEFPQDAPGFVLISSEAEGAEARALSQINRVVLLPKPFVSEQLVAVLNLVSGRSTAGSPAKRGRSDLRVLVVDDSSTARIHVRIVLNGLGIARISEAADGAQAIASATREAFDLIVTDYNMPLMDGRALVSYLKQTPSTAAVPIVMVTTETDAAILDPVRRLGVERIFPKAFPRDEVESLLDKLFGG